MARTTAGAVQTLLGPDYDTVREPTVEPFVASASSIVDRVAACAIRKGVTFSATDAELVERWLAAHLYTKQDRVYQSRSQLGRSGSFLFNKEHPEPYECGALAVDPTGCLASILYPQQVASATWLGKRPSEQIPYDQRS